MCLDVDTKLYDLIKVLYLMIRVLSTYPQEPEDARRVEEAPRAAKGLRVPKSIPPTPFAGGPPETISGKASGASGLRKGDRFRGCLGGEMKRTY